MMAYHAPDTCLGEGGNMKSGKLRFGSDLQGTPLLIAAVALAGCSVSVRTDDSDGRTIGANSRVGNGTVTSYAEFESTGARDKRINLARCARSTPVAITVRFARSRCAGRDGAVRLSGLRRALTAVSATTFLPAAWECRKCGGRGQELRARAALRDVGNRMQAALSGS